LYDDFVELQPGSVQRLEDALNSRNGILSTSLRSKMSFKSLGRILQLPSALHNFTKFLEKRDTELPQHEVQRNSGQPSDPPPQPTEPVYLLLCYPDGIYATRLLQISICDLESDKKLFATLRSTYKAMRGK
jgi:hypothetical protein